MEPTPLNPDPIAASPEEKYQDYLSSIQQTAKTSAGEGSEADLGLLGTLGEVAAAPFRGIAGAAEAVLELPTIFGLNYDIPENLGLGTSSGFVGSLVEEISQFGAGFLGGGAALGAKAFAGLATKTGRFGKMLSGGKLRNSIFKVGVQGAVTDFAFFKGQEGRLSDLIQSFPALQNPINEFLSTKGDDSEIVGRLKNMLEGLGIGFAVDTLIVGLRGHKAGQDALAAGATPEEAYMHSVEASLRANARLMQDTFGIGSTQDALAAGAAFDILDLGASGVNIDGTVKEAVRRTFQMPDGREVEGTSVPSFYSPLHRTFAQIVNQPTAYSLPKNFMDRPASQFLTFDKMSRAGERVTKTEWHYSGIDLIVKNDPNITVRDAMERANSVELFVVEEGLDTVSQFKRMGGDSVHTYAPYQMTEYGAKSYMADFAAGSSGATPERPYREFILSTRDNYADPAAKFDGGPPPGDTGIGGEGFGEEAAAEPFAPAHFTAKDGGPPVIASVRATTRTLPGGQRILFIEEIQSDPIIGATKARSRAQGEEREKVGSGFHAPGSKKGAQSPILNNPAKDPQEPFHTQGNPRRLPDARPWIADANGLKSNDWAALSMRYVLSWAAHKNYSGIGLLTGAQNAKRWGGDLMTGMWDGVKKVRHNEGTIIMEDEAGKVVTMFRTSELLGGKSALKQIFAEHYTPELEKALNLEAVKMPSPKEHGEVMRRMDNLTREAEEVSEDIYTLGGEELRTDYVISQFGDLENYNSELIEAIENHRYGYFYDLLRAGFGDIAVAEDFAHRVFKDMEFNPTVHRVAEDGINSFEFAEPTTIGGKWSRDLYDETFKNIMSKEGKEYGLEVRSAKLDGTPKGDMNPVLLIREDTRDALRKPKPLFQPRGEGQEFDGFGSHDEQVRDHIKQIIAADKFGRTLNLDQVAAQNANRLGVDRVWLRKKYGFEMTLNRMKGLRELLSEKGIAGSGVKDLREEAENIAKRLDLDPEMVYDKLTEIRLITDKNLKAHIEKTVTEGRSDMNLGDIAQENAVGLGVDSNWLYERYVDAEKLKSNPKLKAHIQETVGQGRTDMNLGDIAQENADAFGVDSNWLYEQYTKEAELRANPELKAHIEETVKEGRSDMNLGDIAQENASVYDVDSDWLYEQYTKASNERHLFQGQKDGRYASAKAVTELGEDGSIFIRGLNNPDLSSAVHEMGHAVRNIMYRGGNGGFTNAQKDLLEEWAGASKGVWNEAAEEKFALGFERYVREGEFPNSFSDGLRDIFETLKAAMTRIYQEVTGSAIDVELPKEIRELFDHIVQNGRNPDEVISAHRKLSAEAAQAEGLKTPRQLFQEEGRANPSAVNANQSGKAKIMEQRLIEQYGSLAAAPDRAIAALRRVVKEDPEYVPYDAEEAAEVLGHDVRPKPDPTHENQPKGRPNVRRMVKDDDTRDIIQQRVQEMRLATQRIPLEERVAMAGDAIETFREIIGGYEIPEIEAFLAGRTRALEEAQLDVIALHSVYADVGDDLKETLLAIRKAKGRGGNVSPQLKAKALWLEDRLAVMTRSVAESRGQMGRGLADLKRVPEGQMSFLPESLEDATKHLEEWEGRGTKFDDWYEKRIVALEVGDLSLFKVAHSTGTNPLRVIATELYYNSLLSGIRTQSVNALSNFLNSFYTPIEKGFGRLFVKGADVGEELRPLMGMFSHFKDALQSGWISFKTGSSQLDPGGRHFVDSQGFSHGKTDLGDLVGIENDTARAVTNFLYSIATVPTRALGAMDDMAKQFNYRARIKEDLITEAQSRFPLDGQKQAEFIEDKFRVMTQNGQMYTAQRVYKNGMEEAKKVLKENGEEPTKDRVRAYAGEYLARNFDKELGDIASKSLERAREATFTQANRASLGHNPASRFAQRLGAGTQQLAAKAPFLRLIVPFINTPTNLVSFYLDRQLAPVWDGVRVLRETLSKKALYGSPAEKADAIGRIATGSLFTFGAYMFATSGKITGGGPQDPNARRLWIDAGHQPYSIKVGDKYISYARMDPYASFFGVIADLAESAANFNPEDDDDDMASEILGAVVMAFAQNIGQKTYLQGFTSLAKVIDDPETYSGSYVRNMAGVAVPTLMSQLNGDPYFREIRNVMDKLKSRLPFGQSETLAPRRNVLGEPIEKPGYFGPDGIDFISPFQMSQVSSDALKQEFARLGHGFSPPQATRGGVIDLRKFTNSKGQSSYDRWQELHQTTRVGGKTLREALEKLIGSNQYQRMLDPLDEESSPRVAAIRGVITEYRSKAYKQVLREFDELRQAEKAVKQNLKARRLGRASQILHDINNF